VVSSCHRGEVAFGGTATHHHTAMEESPTADSKSMTTEWYNVTPKDRARGTEMKCNLSATMIQQKE
jgi:hypothetical protein